MQQFKVSPVEVKKKNKTNKHVSKEADMYLFFSAVLFSFAISTFCNLPCETERNSSCENAHLQRLLPLFAFTVETHNNVPEQERAKVTVRRSEDPNASVAKVV